MNNFKKFSIIFIIIVIGLLTFIIIKSFAKDDSNELKNKVLNEIRFFESKLVNIYNLLNNIELENYQLTIEDISEKSKKATDNNEEKKQNESGEESKVNDESSNKENDQNSKNNSDLESSSKENKKYSLNPKGILTSNQNIKWDDIKINAEILESSISSMTLDLYELCLNNLDVVNFSKEYDNLLFEIKNEDKQKTLDRLNVIYNYLPRFIKNCDIEPFYELIISTKLNIFNAYSLLDINDWDAITKYLDEAIKIFSSLLTDINIKNKNQHIINKCYITLNGLRNSINLKDKEIFLIKYKNLLEDFNSL